MKKSLLKKDIKYKGILNYKTLKILSIILISLSQISLAFFIWHGLKLKMNGQEFVYNESIYDFLFSLSTIGVPLLLVSTFSSIINNKDKIRKTIITYAVVAFVIYISQVLAFNFFLGPIIDKYNVSPDFSTSEIINTISYLFSFFNNLNIFIDLLICSLFYFFFCYTPTKIKKKNLWKFRLLSLLPICYMIGSFILIALNHNNNIFLNNEISGLLTFRKPPIFLFFILYCVFIKYRDYFLKKKYKTNKNVEKFKKSNRNSLIISIYLIVFLLITCGIDFGLSFFDWSKSFGFGQTYKMVYCCPILLLFSPTKIINSKILDIITFSCYFIDCAILAFLYISTALMLKDVLKVILKVLISLLPFIKEILINGV